jgi:hypothetical protein
MQEPGADRVDLQPPQGGFVIEGAASADRAFGCTMLSDQWLNDLTTRVSITVMASSQKRRGLPLLIRIPSMLIRVSGALVLILGIIFWTGHLDAGRVNLQGLHIALGIVLVLSLFWLAALNYRNSGNVGLSVAAFVDGVALYIVGQYQAGWLPNAHWVIQVIHLALGLAAIGLGEALGARLSRMPALAAS